MQEVFKNLRGHGKLSESNVTDACRNIRMALLEADVHFQVVKTLVERIRERAMGKEVLQSITPGQQMTKVFHDELAALMGDARPLATGSPLRILLCGLQGSGKTTTCAKLALWLSKQGRTPMLVAADLQRPAAITQLESLGQQLGIPVYADKTAKDPVAVCRAGLEAAASQSRNVILFDTAGRLDIDEELQAQLQRVHAEIKPQETLFVADAAMGQKAVEIVGRFAASVPLTGIILTRLDGDARGGAALSMREITGLPLLFLGTGEKPDQLELMSGERLAGRILGMGDIVGFVEKAQELVERQDAAALEERMRKQTFDLDDMLFQLQQVRKLGPLENLLGMLPGMPKMDDSARAERQLKRTEAILLSMTPQERRKPDLLNARRRLRIAAGSGTSVTVVNDLLRQFQMMKKMMKSKGKMKRMMAQLGLRA